MENLGRQTATTDSSIAKRIQEIVERISGIEDKIEEIDSPVKENIRARKLLIPNIRKSGMQ